MNRLKIDKGVQIWLLIGVIMVLVQILIGGVTRLTDSGLSITEWKIIQGTIFPLNETEWLIAFDAYKVAAKKQFETLHADMTLAEFKFIYFWEYLHRLWARLMGFVFLFPFLYFWKGHYLPTMWKSLLKTSHFSKSRIPKWLMGQLGIVILFAVLVAVFGWIMVKSGLNDDKRTWVSAYKLMTHLGIATILFAFLFWAYLRVSLKESSDYIFPKLKKLSWIITILIFIQILFGGLMAGMRAGLLHPYFPATVNGEYLWEALTATIQPEEILDYEPAMFMKAVVQIIHRGTAYLLVGLIIWFFIKSGKSVISPLLQKGRKLLLIIVALQFILGILTIINCLGRVPLLYGVLHQIGALFLLAAALFVNYQFRKPEINVN